MDVQTRRENEWMGKNPVLRRGELGYNSSNSRLKIGDGVTPWNDLTYVALGASSNSEEAALIECRVGGELVSVYDRSPYSGQLVPGSDHIAHLKTLTFGIVPIAPTSVQVLMRVKRGELPVLTSEQLNEIGALGGYSVDGTRVRVFRLDISGSAQLSILNEQPIDDQPLYFTLNGEVGDHGVGVPSSGDSITFEPGAYMVTVSFSLDVYWG